MSGNIQPILDKALDGERLTSGGCSARIKVLSALAPRRRQDTPAKKSGDIVTIDHKYQLHTNASATSCVLRFLPAARQTRHVRSLDPKGLQSASVRDDRD